MTELERQAQVEAAWAVRAVFAAMLNEHRLDAWHARKAAIFAADLIMPKPQPWFARRVQVAA